MVEPTTFEVGTEEFLLVVVGTNYHGVRRPTHRAHEQWSSWSPRTACGREWWVLADSDGDPILGWAPAVAPTCRGCLRILTRDLASTPADERIPPLAAAMI